MRIAVVAGAVAAAVAGAGAAAAVAAGAAAHPNLQEVRRPPASAHALPAKRVSGKM